MAEGEEFREENGPPVTDVGPDGPRDSEREEVDKPGSVYQPSAKKAVTISTVNGVVVFFAALATLVATYFTIIASNYSIEVSKAQLGPKVLIDVEGSKNDWNVFTQEFSVTNNSMFDIKDLSVTCVIKELVYGEGFPKIICNKTLSPDSSQPTQPRAELKVGHTVSHNCNIDVKDEIIRFGDISVKIEFKYPSSST